MQTTKEPNKGKIRGANPMNSTAFKIAPRRMLKRFFRFGLVFVILSSGYGGPRSQDPTGPLTSSYQEMLLILCILFWSVWWWALGSVYYILGNWVIYRGWVGVLFNNPPHLSSSQAGTWAGTE